MTPGDNAAQLAAQPRPDPFMVGDYLVEVTDGPKLQGTLLDLSVRVTRDGQEVPVSNPLLFANPPVESDPPVPLDQVLRTLIADTVAAILRLES